MRLLLLALLALSLNHSPASAAPAPKSPPAKPSASAFSRNPAVPKWAGALEQVPETNIEEPVVVRLAETHYWMGPNPAHLVNRAVQVNSSSRLSEIGQFSIEFVPAYQKLIVHRIAVLRGKEVMDRTRSANVRILDRETDAEKGYYLGAATAQVLLDDVAPGDTLWLTYTIEGRNPVYGSTWSENLSWTKAEPVEMRKLVVAYPSDRSPQWRLSGMKRESLAAPVIEQGAGITRMTFKERGLAAEEFEPSLPPNLVPFPVLNLTEYKDWTQVTKWAMSLFPNTSNQPDVQAALRKFDAKSLEDRASQALHWVQDDIRYFSVSMGENSHRPQPPEVVLKRRFGDCKDKSHLLVALYRAMGLEAQPVLVNATTPTLPAQLLPSPGSFNHAIVRVVIDGKAYFVDPTRQHERGRISQLPPAVPGGAALVIDAASTGLVTLPEESVEAPLMERTERMEIATLNGEAKLNVRTEYRGRLAASMRNAFRAMGSFDLKKFLLSEVERTYPGIKLDGAPVLSDGAEGTSFVVEARLTVPKPLKDEEGHYKLPLRSHILEGTLGIPDKLMRKHPLWLSAGRYRARYNLDVSLPSEARLVQQDDRFALNTKFVEARAQLTWRGSHLDYYIDYAITNPEVAPSELPALEEQVRKLNPLFESKLDFVPVTVPPLVAKDASLRVLDILSKLDAYEDLQDETIRTGKIPEIKLDEATLSKLNYRSLCDSTVNLFTVRDWNPMLAAPAYALRKIIDAKSDKRSKDLCLARANLVEYDLPQASKALAALEPANDDPLTLMQAWADFHAGDSDRAWKNLSRFLKAKMSAGELSARDAAVGFSLARRLGKSEPAEVREVVETLRADAWPIPLFHLLRGELTDEDLLKRVDQLPPAAREYAALEAHFFISQAYLAANEPRKADLHLNWLIRFALLGSDYEVLARADRFGKDLADPDVVESVKLANHRGMFRTTSAQVQHLKSAVERDNAVAEYRLGYKYLLGDGVSQDGKKALPLLEAAAAKGNTDAMNTLGTIYVDGEIVPKDERRGVSYFKQAIEHGDAFGAYNLGRAHWFGWYGQPNDFVQAFRLLRDAAEMEQRDAQFYLSRMYYDGLGTEKNDALARFWAVQAHLRKNRNGTAQLGRILLSSGMDRETRQTGLHLLEYAALLQNNFARLEYGKALLDGIYIEPNAASAFRLVQAAANAGNDEARALLGRMYVEGLGVTADRAKGLEILKTLEQAGLPEAFYQLGVIYKSDTAGMADKAKAAEYFRQGAAKGQLEAAEMIGIMSHTGEGIPANLADAIRFYQMVVQAGKPRALNNLAAMYENGQGVAKDMTRAMDLYRRAAQSGSISAMLNLAEVYEADAKDATKCFVPLAYYMLADRFQNKDAAEGLQRLKARTDPETTEKAQKYASSWKPGKAMPEEV